jgi:hypothetical protein
MTDTPESVRKLAEELYGADPFNYDGGVYDALYRYADLLERIEKAPRARIRYDGTIYWSLDRSLAGKRVALVEI